VSVTVLHLTSPRALTDKHANRSGIVQLVEHVERFEINVIGAVDRARHAEDVVRDWHSATQLRIVFNIVNPNYCS
jgi:hypothetical protein